MEWWGWLVLVFFLMLGLEALICAGCHFAVHKNDRASRKGDRGSGSHEDDDEERAGIVYGPGASDGYVDAPPPSAAREKKRTQDRTNDVEDIVGLSTYAPQRDNERGVQRAPTLPLRGSAAGSTANVDSMADAHPPPPGASGTSPWRHGTQSAHGGVDVEMQPLGTLEPPRSREGSHIINVGSDLEDASELTSGNHHSAMQNDSMISLPSGALPVARDPMREILSPDHLPEGAHRHEADALVLRASMLPASAAPYSLKHDDRMSNSL